MQQVYDILNPCQQPYLFITLLWKLLAMPTIIDVENGVEQF